MAAASTPHRIAVRRMPRACASEGLGVAVMASQGAVEDLRPELRHREDVEQHDKRPERQGDGEGTPAAALKVLGRQLGRHYTRPVSGRKKPKPCSARRAAKSRNR